MVNTTCTWKIRGGLKNGGVMSKGQRNKHEELERFEQQNKKKKDALGYNP